VSVGGVSLAQAAMSFQKKRVLEFVTSSAYEFYNFIGLLATAASVGGTVWLLSPSGLSC
jgi:hypothetical protein